MHGASGGGVRPPPQDGLPRAEFPNSCGWLEGVRCPPPGLPVLPAALFLGPNFPCGVRGGSPGLPQGQPAYGRERGRRAVSGLSRQPGPTSTPPPARRCAHRRPSPAAGHSGGGPATPAAVAVRACTPRPHPAMAFGWRPTDGSGDLFRLPRLKSQMLADAMVHCLKHAVSPPLQGIWVQESRLSLEI